MLKHDNTCNIFADKLAKESIYISPKSCACIYFCISCSASTQVTCCSLKCAYFFNRLCEANYKNSSRSSSVSLLMEVLVLALGQLALQFLNIPVRLPRGRMGCSVVLTQQETYCHSWTPSSVNTVCHHLLALLRTACFACCFLPNLSRSIVHLCSWRFY